VYVAGLLACYRCHVYPIAEDGPKQHVINSLEKIFSMTPLENVAEMLLRYPHLHDSARKIFDSYNEFIRILSDDDKRERPDALGDNDDSDEVYQAARALSHIFRDGLLEFFFDPQTEMEMLTKNYGVF